MSARSDCRKFAPNIFNKSKCTNCFRQKEEHSAEALECNRASRKVSKCGYLFVAPGWDFSNPLNRTKRWQRRWFVLYDDGELTYSLDEHPDTVPQACVDMTGVLEVRDADEVTGHPHSLAIAAPDRVTFVKGACREEARWWSDVLSVFPRSKGRHKRNATFPGGQATSLLQNGTAIRNGVGNGARPRHNSCHAGGWTAPPRPATVADISSVATPVSSLPPTPTPPLATPETKVYTDQPVSSASPPTRDKINSEDKARSRRGAARERRRAAWDAAAAQDESSEAVQHRILLEEYDEESKREEKLKDIAASLTRPRERPPLSPPNNSSQTLPEPPTRETTSSAIGTTMDDVDSSIPDKYVRGDPDGCVRGAAARVELPAEGLLNMRKGWLLRQAGPTSATSPPNPSQHWFVLRGAALLYYRDPSAEDCGIMDGVIDLNGVAGVVEAPPARTFGFLIKTWDNRQYMLSAMTAGIRANWVSAIRKTAGLPDPAAQCPDKLYAEKPIIKLERQDSIESADSAIIPTSPITPITPMTPRSVMFSSDEEYRTASEGGRRDSVDWGDSISQLPPSPILNRNPISRVKDKVRSRNLHPTSLPSSPDETPPSDIDETDNLPDRSLREILDPFTPIIKEIIRKDDLAKPLKTSYISTIDKQAIEIEDLRKQLKVAQTDVSLAEKELKRLRQVKSDSVLREKRMDDLLSTLQKTEEELNLRTKEAENLETLKKMYNQDKNLWESKLSETETFLRDSTEHCELLNRQLANGQETIQRLQEELSQLNERLMRGAEENEALFLKIRDIEGRSSSLSMTRGKGRSVESLSDLTNIDLDQDLENMNKERLIEEYDELRGRFEKAVHEIRAMKRELRESHNLYDELELTNLGLRRDIKLQEENNDSQISMMAARIQDLTQKLSASDKQVRALKHKLQKSDARDKRRSLSLKGKDSFSIGKEVEEKLTELENKITTLEGGIIVPTEAPVIKSPSKPPSPTKEKSPSKEKESTSESKSLKRMSARLRRKSLDSATSSEPMKVLIRLSSLETKVGNALLNKRDLATSCESLSQTISDSPTLTDATDTHSNSSHRHLLDRLQSLENVVILSRNKVNDCICQVSAIRASRNRRSPSPVLDKSYSMKTIERCLTDVSKTLQDCTDKCVLPFESIYEGDLNESVINVVHQLELQLRSKLLDINKKKCALLESGELNQRRNLEFLAEKLAYEAVLISRVNDAVVNTNGDSLFKRLIKSEVEETSQLVTSLQSKLNGSQIKRQTLCKTSMDYLAKILSRKINFVNNTNIDKTTAHSQNIIQMKELDMLKASQKEITITVNQYKTEKLVELTKTLILEALTCETGTIDQDRANIENMRIQEAWHKAQDVVNHELMNSEISHVMKRCAQLYGTQLEAEKKGRFTLVASQQAALEKWFQVAHQRLSDEMKEAIADITSLYQECLTNVRLRTPINEDRPATDSRQLLNELADVIAHKALIDAKIYVCTGGYETDSPTDANERHNYPKGMHSENSWNKSESENVVASLDSDPAQEAEFIYLFQHFSNECRALFSDEYTDNKEDLIKISDALRQVELVVKHLHLQIGSDIADNKDDKKEQSKTQVQGVLELCESLKKSVEALSSHIPCQHCLRLQSAIDRLRLEHEETLAALKSEQDRGGEGKKSAELLRGRARTAEDLVSSLQQQQRTAQRRVQRSESEVTLLKQQISQHQSECQHLQVQHEQEQTQLKERTRRLERRLGTLDSEYSQQLEQLRSAYHKTIGADIQGDSIRQRYQAEIEQLRVLCEKGLLAMESSHRRVIQELEDKHRVEREQLRVDKEQALAEETQATLAALDAMRKAHENEVQREVTKFKREFVTRTQHGGDLGQVHSRHQEEMEEIKQEILSLSEKYSVKCVESAALEEKLCNVTQQLTQAQQHIMQLDARNKQLRAHLMSEVNEMNSSEIASLGSSSSSSKATRPNQLTLEPAKSVVRKTKIQFAKTESTRNLRLSPVQN